MQIENNANREIQVGRYNSNKQISDNTLRKYKNVNFKPEIYNLGNTQPKMQVGQIQFGQYESNKYNS